MEIIWFSKDDLIGSIKEFVEKHKSRRLDGIKDVELFFKALFYAILQAKKSEIDEILEFYEEIEVSLEEHGSFAYFIEVTGSDKKIVIYLSEDEQKIGTYTGEFEKLEEINENIWFEWGPEEQMLIMEGDPTNDPPVLEGKWKGNIFLAEKLRDFINYFFIFIDETGLWHSS
ncbi:MAG: hypothetical protein HWN65_02935 [Candidatus Helarchaeota archaeon]|nr:hypothetical protein [Candidatus Helarchaeota archaeon]